MPPNPGLFSAVGLLCSGVEHHEVRSCLLSGEQLTPQALAAIRGEIDAALMERFGSEGFAGEEVELLCSVDMRFKGQASEIRIELPGATDGELIPRLSADFEEEHERLYGHRSDPDNPIEVIAVRGIGRTGGTGLPGRTEPAGAAAQGGERAAYFGSHGSISTPVVARADPRPVGGRAAADRRVRLDHRRSPRGAGAPRRPGQPPDRDRFRMSAVDPITREIIQNALAASADEMAVALYRTAYSTVVRDCLDYSTSLCDANGDMIAQGVTIPLHLGAVPYAMETLFEKFEGDMEPGDVFIMNDPFDGGMHIPDIFIVKPIFHGEERIGFAVSTAHHLDLGGRLPGSSACDNTEIFHDGLRIPWLKLHHRGVPDDALYTLLRANVRVPRMTLGDLNAQLSACHIGERRILELAAKYGVETFRSCAADLIDYTERLVRAEIASWPDGSHTFTDYLDSNGVGGPRVKLRVTLTVEGDSLTADFRGTDPQAPGAINNSLSFTASVANLCVRSVFREEIPNTAGMFRPIRIVTEPGTVVHGVMPAASSMRGITGFRLVDTMFGALSGIVPDRVMAAGEGGNSLVIIGGEHGDKSPYVYFELICGTWGGRPDRDGIDGITNPANVASNVPVEQAESEVPAPHRALRPRRRQRGSREVPRRHGHRAGVDPAEGRRPPRDPLRPPRPPSVRTVRRPAGIAFELDPARARGERRSFPP